MVSSLPLISTTTTTTTTTTIPSSKSGNVFSFSNPSSPTSSPSVSTPSSTPSSPIYITTSTNKSTPNMVFFPTTSLSSPSSQPFIINHPQNSIGKLYLRLVGVSCTPPLTRRMSTVGSMFTAFDDDDLTPQRIEIVPNAGDGSITVKDIHV